MGCALRCAAHSPPPVIDRSVQEFRAARVSHLRFTTEADVEAMDFKFLCKDTVTDASQTQKSLMMHQGKSGKALRLQSVANLLWGNAVKNLM